MMDDDDADIAVVGIGCNFPGGTKKNIAMYSNS